MFLKKGLLFITTFVLLAFVGQASAGPNANATLSLDLITDGGAGNKRDDGVTSGTILGQGTKIAVEVFAQGVTTTLIGVKIEFEFDASVLKLDKVENSAFLFAIPEPTGVNFAAIAPVTLPSSGFIGRAEFSTVADVTGKEFTLGIKAVTLAQTTSSSDVITTINVISFNKLASDEFAGMQLHLDKQIETPATDNNALTISEKKAGDTIRLQLFVPMAAGKQTYGYEIELDLPGKIFFNYIGSISGTDFTGASLFPTPGRPILSALLLSTPIVPANGYLGQIDLQVTNSLDSETTLIVKAASMAGLNRQQDPLDVSNAVITFTVISYPGDFDGDLDVDFADFLAFAGVLGLSSSNANYDARMDMNDDGIINFADFLVFVGVFGSSYDQSIVYQTFDLPGGSLEDFRFTVDTDVRQNVILQGEFSVENGTVQMAVMGESEYQTWQEGGTPVVLYSPGETSGETFRLPIDDSDTYYIIFRNTGTTAVKVEAKIFLF